MDADLRIDVHLDQAMEELLSLASLAAMSGRPEVALRASAALDQLLAVPVDDAALAGPGLFPILPGENPHAQH